MRPRAFSGRTFNRAVKPGFALSAKHLKDTLEAGNVKGVRKMELGAAPDIDFVRPYAERAHDDALRATLGRSPSSRW